ncbi:MAG: FKBP-type peptidyl-prolyl cis-trans isomerase [Planctomycetes bacterium]|nr:FKBP-type peptidyl-prolyl cis-trans isomerase [Planctomycetota bacterium]
MTVIAIVVAFVGAGITWMLISSADPDSGGKGKAFVTRSGIKVVEEKIGPGKVAEPGRTVTFHFTVWDGNGDPIGTTHGKKPVTFVLGKKQQGIPPAWHEGIAGMKEGGARELIVPPKLALSPGEDAIPPDEALTFKIELLKVQ